MPDIVSAALRYNGAGYQFGGSPASGIGHWDCSSFVNWVVGNDCRMGIPGYPAGAYHGQTHGPVVVDWTAWSGASKISGAPSPGDIAIWPGIGALGHMGIVTGPNQMISALNSRLGTKVTPISGYGPLGVAVIYKSLTGNNSTGGQNNQGCPATIGLILRAFL